MTRVAPGGGGSAAPTGPNMYPIASWTVSEDPSETNGLKWKQVQDYLNATDPGTITNAGNLHNQASQSLATLANRVASHAQTLSENWSGDRATDAINQFQDLYNSASTASTANWEVGNVLSWYGNEILPWYVQNAPHPGTLGGLYEDLGGDDTNADNAAQQHLARLNGRIAQASASYPTSIYMKLPASSDPGGGHGPGGGGGGGVPGGGVPGGGLPGGGLPGGGLPGGGPGGTPGGPGGGIPGGGMPGGPGGGVPGGGGGGGSLAGIPPGGPGGGGLPGGGLPGGGLPGGGLPGGGLPGGGAGGRLPGMPLPGMGGLGGDPFDGPGGLGDGLGGLGGAAGAAAGGEGAGLAGRGLGAAGEGAAASEGAGLAGEAASGGGMAGMPMGGAGGGQGGKERERQTWLTEDEDVWGSNEGDVAPPVIG